MLGVPAWGRLIAAASAAAAASCGAASRAEHVRQNCGGKHYTEHVGARLDLLWERRRHRDAALVGVLKTPKMGARDVVAVHEVHVRHHEREDGRGCEAQRDLVYALAQERLAGCQPLRYQVGKTPGNRIVRGSGPSLRAKGV